MPHPYLKLVQPRGWTACPLAASFPYVIQRFWVDFWLPLLFWASLMLHLFPSFSCPFPWPPLLSWSRVMSTLDSPDVPAFAYALLQTYNKPSPPYLSFLISFFIHTPPHAFQFSNLNNKTSLHYCSRMPPFTAFIYN